MIRNLSVFLVLVFIGCAPSPKGETSPDDTLSISRDTLVDMQFPELNDFPSEWIMLVNMTPDSIIPTHMVMMNSDSTFFCKASIKERDNRPVLVFEENSGADEYYITSFKKQNEAEMIYYNMDLLSTSGDNTKRLQINYRENPENPQSSVWSFSTGAGSVTDYEMISRPLSKFFAVFRNEHDN